VPLPAPHLDDRHFQDLVDDAKRLVQQRCPEWTDHNVSDPGVTLIEAFAQMVDQLIYRLNRVPDRHYVKFLDLLGVELLPPAPARGEVTFWLSAPQPQTVSVRAETQVATARTDVQDPVVFSTVRGLDIVSCSFAHVASEVEGQEPVDRDRELLVPGGFPCFSRRPGTGDALLVGLSVAVPHCAVLIRVDCPVQGVGVDPRHPPLVWEAWNGSGWSRCDVERDDTGGFNRAGDVVLHVPGDHQTALKARLRAGWLRCRVRPAQDRERPYQESPRIRGLTAFTVGGTVEMAHAEAVRDEELGTAEGTPGQRLQLRRRPVVAWPEDTVLQVSDGDTWRDWARVPHFADSAPDAECFRMDLVAGEVELGPAVREADGTLHQYGAVPHRGALLRLSSYHTGGGRRGNVARGQVRVLKTSVPYIARVENRVPAVGGVEAETVDDAKVRGPVLLRSSGRAVTAEDFELLAREAAPGAARVLCLPSADPAEAGVVRVVLVPHVATDPLGAVERRDLRPPESMLADVRARLEERRLVGTRILVIPAEYIGVTVVVRGTARRGHDPGEVREEVLRTLYRFLHPVTGGQDGRGWPFGRAVRAPEVHAALAALPGLDLSGQIDLQLFPADADGNRASAVDRLDLPPHGLVHSYAHQVRVQR
jgi:predicted phage baseplate assembly protein